MGIITERCNLCNEALPDGWATHVCKTGSSCAGFKPVSPEQLGVALDPLNELRKKVMASNSETATLIASIFERINALDKRVNDQLNEMTAENVSLIAERVQKLCEAVGRLQEDQLAHAHMLSNQKRQIERNAKPKTQWHVPAGEYTMDEIEKIYCEAIEKMRTGG